MYFSEILDSLSVDGSHYRLTVGEDWLQGRAMFGGLVAGVGNEAMRKLVPRDRALRSLLVWTLEFFEHELEFPAQAWWRIDSDIDAASDGYVNQTGLLHDPNGRPVALSRQLFAVFG